MRINLFVFALVLYLGTAIAHPVARSDDTGLSFFDDDLTPDDAVLDVRAPNNDFTNPDDDEEDTVLDVRAPPKKAAASKKAPAAKKVASPKAPVAKKVSTPKAPVAKKSTAKKTSAPPAAAKKKTTAPPAAKKKTTTPPVAKKKTTAPAKKTTGKTTTPPAKKTTGKTTTPPGKKTTGKTTTPPGKKTTGKTTPPSTGPGCPVKGKGKKRGVNGLMRRTEQNLKIGETSVVVTEVKTSGTNSRIFTTDFGFGGKADVIIKCPTGSKAAFDKEVANTKQVDASGVFPVKLFVDSGVGILDCDETKPLNCLVLTDLTKHGFTELSKAAAAKGKGTQCSTLMEKALGTSEQNIIQLDKHKIGHGDLDPTNTFTNADGSQTIFIDWADLVNPEDVGGVATLLSAAQTTFEAEKQKLC